LGTDHARTYPDRNLIQIRHSVYEGARTGGGQDAFTIAHEIGHLFLHRGATAYARTAMESGPHPTWCDSEWQADCYAAELLMPHAEVLLCTTPEEIQRRFGVSFQAASVRFDKCKNKGVNR